MVDSAQTACYDTNTVLGTPAPGEPFAGQDAQYAGNAMNYTLGGDGLTVYDNVTGLTWTRSADLNDDGVINVSDKLVQADAVAYADTVMNGQTAMFGLNLVDGRIKGYPVSGKSYYALFVRGNTNVGINAFVDNGDGTVADHATGFMWQQADSGAGMDWPDALAYAETLDLAGHDDWRLPNAKELQSLVDYSRSPDATGSAALDPVFACTGITNEAGQPDFPCTWSSTTHARADGSGTAAACVAFGRAMGCMHGRWMDVHGAGAQRSDPKTGDPSRFPRGRGPQGDAVRILNFVRCVRGE